MKNLQSLSVPMGKIQAFSPPIMGPDAFRGGPIIPQEELIDYLSHYSYQQKIYRVRADEIYPNHVPGRASYGGPIINHFGHFISSAVHRIIPSRILMSCNRHVFVTTSNDKNFNTFERLPEFSRQVFDFLELNDQNTVIVNQNSIFDELCIVEQGMSIGRRPHIQYLDMLGTYSYDRLRTLNQGAIPSRKVFVCGRRGPGGNVLGVEYIEDLLERDGFWLFRPENYHYAYQAHVYNQAELLIFIEGSAIHGASLLGKNMLNEVSIISRRPSASGNFHSELSGKCRSLDVSFCPTFLGTLIFDKITQTAANHFGISVFNPESTRQFFLSKGVHSFFHFNSKDYFESAEKELVNYISWASEPQRSNFMISHLSDICAQFELLKRSKIN